MRRAWSLLLLLAACRREPPLEYHVLELPGLAIEVPTEVTYGRDMTAEYRAGHVEGKMGTRLVSIGWQVGAPSTPEELPKLLNAMTDVLPHDADVTLDIGKAAATKVRGHDATRVDARLGPLELSMIDIACGHRSVMLSVIARDPHEMRERALASFDCHPVPDQEAKIASAVPFGVDDPALLQGWKRVATGEESSFTISNGQYFVTFVQIPKLPDIADEAVYQNVFTALFKATGSTWRQTRSQTRQIRGQSRMFISGQMIAEGETSPAVITAWNCAARGDAVLALAIAEAAHEAAAIEFLAALRCAEPKDPAFPQLALPPATPATPAK